MEPRIDYAKAAPGVDPDKWDSCRTRYAGELGSRPEAWQPIVSAPDAGPSHSSTVRMTRNTTMRSPCSSTCERGCGDGRSPRGPSRDYGGRVDDARHATARAAPSIQRPTDSAVPPRSHGVGATPP